MKLAEVDYRDLVENNLGRVSKKRLITGYLRADKSFTLESLENN